MRLISIYELGMALLYKKSDQARKNYQTAFTSPMAWIDKWSSGEIT